MKRPALKLDFVAGATPAPWPGLLLLAAAIALALLLGLEYQRIRGEGERLDVIEGLAVPAERQTHSTTRDAHADDLAKDAQAAVRELALPWAALIGALEKATTADVAMLQVQPEAQRGLLRITAEARTPKAMLAYIAKLQADPTLADVHWVNHQFQNDDPQRPLQFSLEAHIRGQRAPSAEGPP